MTGPCQVQLVRTVYFPCLQAALPSATPPSTISRSTVATARADRLPLVQVAGTPQQTQPATDQRYRSHGGKLWLTPFRSSRRIERLRPIMTDAVVVTGTAQQIAQTSAATVLSDICCSGADPAVNCPAPESSFGYHYKRPAGHIQSMEVQ